ncbi:MAG: F0F1 ATP synthase subunit epsilon [Erysipelotrichaceae bacterium]|nr:F0F1 ATP synthase subunit epsilon [Erysipelotrichaceae bacterium]
MLFKADLITYYGVYRTIETDKLNVPTPEGRRTILSNHMPIMLPLEIGVIETGNSGKLSHYAINGGVLYFRDNKAELVLNNVIDVEEIDVEKVKGEVERIGRELKSVSSESRRIRLGYELEVAENRLKAAEKYL